jgi:heme/copper-type cytochrome/quinol oxidase subunit 1
MPTMTPGTPRRRVSSTRYVWSQDHKVIAIQYASVAIAVGLLGVVLS